MGVLIGKQRGEKVFTRMGKLAIIGFLVAIALALIDTIWAVYMDSFVHSEAIVGFISAALTLIAIVSCFVLVPIIEKYKKSSLFFWSLILFGITYLLFAINTKFYIFVILAFFLTIFYILRMNSYGIIVKDKSTKTQLSKNEGLIYTFMNLAWVIGPLIAGYLANAYGINLIFLVSAIFVFLSALAFKVSKINDVNIKKKLDKNIFKNTKEFFKNKNRVLSYFISGAVNCWWVLIYLFMPMHIIRTGLNNLWIGYFLFAVAVPLVLFEYKFSKLAGKKGFRKIFKTGFGILALISLFCFFISNIYLVLLLLALASIGMAMLESTTEAYFFDIINKKQECKYYGPYNTGIDVCQFIGKILASVVLIFLPFNYIFLLFGALMFLMFLLSFKIKNVIENRKAN
ncbi:MAG: MFS transporter [Nanoarchaeota archaeon]|nr:MFS transporter [Nanoarchaeota archaeon]